MEQLRDLPFAPSVQSHGVPRKTVAQEIGLAQDEDDGDEELDNQIRRRCHILLHKPDLIIVSPGRVQLMIHAEDVDESAEESIGNRGGWKKNIYHSAHRYSDSDQEMVTSDDDDHTHPPKPPAKPSAKHFGPSHSYRNRYTHPRPRSFFANGASSGVIPTVNI